MEEAESALALGVFTVDAVAAVPPEIAALVGERSAAKAKKDFAQADFIRKQIEDLGWLVKDGKDGSQAVKK